MNTGLVHMEGNKVFLSSLIIARSCDNRSHESIMGLLTKHRADFEELGEVQLRTATLQTSEGLQETTYCDLTEDQATLLVAYLSNTPKVRELKVMLVKSFRGALNEMTRLYATPPRDGIIGDKRQAHNPVVTALNEMKQYLGNET